jgi:hypothetical protein
MDRSKAVIGIMAMLFFMGVGGLLRYSEKLLDSSENVRMVHIIGLIASGMNVGASIVGVIAAVVLRRTRATTDNRPLVK